MQKLINNARDNANIQEKSKSIMIIMQIQEKIKKYAGGGLLSR